MGIKDWFQDVFKEDVIIEDEQVPVEPTKAKRGGKRMSKINIVEPRVYSEVQTIADALLAHQSVLLNLRRVDDDQARRIVDYLAGIAYAIEGDMQKLSAEIFLCVPENVEIEGTLSEIVEDNSAYFLDNM